MDNMNEAVLELTTRISKEKLVYAICEFYWNIGHSKIELIKEIGNDIKSEEYASSKTIESVSAISEISILLSKDRKEKLEFDFITISIEDAVFERKILWGVDQKIKIIHVVFAVFFVVAFIATIIYGYHNIYPTNHFLSRYGTALFAVLIFVPIIKLLYYLFERKIERVQSHPTTIKCKNNFEDFIHSKEKELRSERY
ncbi:hypothetical protein [uncultured Methanolobus sp.]|uniref:hypothetical protein n=1 Tax=uncultured Methanolobus sp. TaxID=218300 RepID=UPI002AAB8264|nr:hypothetical protein [uncultured Methanolobus sp.]